MNGILNLLKPPGMTSFDVVAHIRGLTRTRKVGHTGTLDPMAAGVLTVCTGNATGAIEFLVEKDKLYRAELTLGISTDTQDSTGTVLSQAPVNASDREIEDAVRSFIGSYGQIPPMYSAIRRDGKKLYELAREGVSVDRAPRRVELYSADVVRITRRIRDTSCRQAAEKTPQDVLNGPVKVLFDAHCSKGTYIRTLCSDIGDRLGCGGHMSFLLRKRAGAFALEDALTLEELKALAEDGRLREALLDVETAFGELEAVALDEVREKKFLNGVRFDSGCGPEHGGLVRVYGPDGGFLALGELYDDSGRRFLKSRKIFKLQ